MPGTANAIVRCNSCNHFENDVLRNRLSFLCPCSTSRGDCRRRRWPPTVVTERFQGRAKDSFQKPPSHLELAQHEPNDKVDSDAASQVVLQKCSLIQDSNLSSAAPKAAFKYDLQPVQGVVQHGVSTAAFDSLSNPGNSFDYCCTSQNPFFPSCIQISPGGWSLHQSRGGCFSCLSNSL